MKFKKKKKRRGFRITKQDKDRHRKIIRQDDDRPDKRAGIRIDPERYMMAIATLKRKLAEVSDGIAFLLANADIPEKKEKEQDLNHAREYILFAKDRLGDTTFIFTDVVSKPKKKLHRRKKKLHRRKT